MTAVIAPSYLPFLVKSKANYTARSANEIDLLAGQTYTVSQTDGKGHWWQAQADSTHAAGWFPAGFVEIVGPVPAVASPPPAALPRQNTTPAVQQNPTPQPVPRPTPTPQPQPPPVVAAKPVPPQRAASTSGLTSNASVSARDSLPATPGSRISITPAQPPNNALPTPPNNALPQPPNNAPNNALPTPPVHAQPQPPSNALPRPPPQVQPQPPSNSLPAPPTHAQPPTPTPQPQPPSNVLPTPVHAQPPTPTPQPSSPNTSSQNLPIKAGIQPLKQPTPVGDKPPPPKKTKAEPGVDTSAFCLHIQIQEVQLKDKKANPTAFIFRKNIYGGDNVGEQVLVGENHKASSNLVFGELFRLSIKNRENDVVVIRFVNGTKWDSKKVIADKEISLRAATAEFDSPGWKNMFFPLGLGSDKNRGEAKLYIEFFDNNKYEGPSNVQHLKHIGVDASGVFSANNIPDDWKDKLKAAKVPKAALANPTIRHEIFEALAAADAQEGKPAPAPPPPGQEMKRGGPPPPPAGEMKRGGPPPPPGPGPLKAPPPVAPKPPPTTAPASSGGGGGDFLAELANAKLKPASEREHEPEHIEPEPAQGLQASLINALQKHRIDIAGDNGWDEDDEWSD